jgi:hypothetical protein
MEEQRNMDQHVVIHCDCSPTLIRIERHLRKISEMLSIHNDAIDDIYTVLDSIDDISDITVAMKESINRIKNIGETNTTNGGT